MEEYYEKEREQLYEEDGVIMHSPYIEIVKKYDGKKTLSEICNENQINMKIADFLNSGLLLTEDGEERRLYEHQEEAIIDVLKKKKNMVITTGTGSGKTESFLIPLLANMIEESLSWKSNEKEPALRAIIFYPLNALAEDQMVRLRKSLARDEVTEWYQKNEIKNHITFGRYIGRTPKDTKDQKYKDIGYRWNSIKSNINNPETEKHKNNLQNLIFTGPCCEKGSAEIIDRKKMQETPPDILITNYSMLNIMLMRKAEQNIFDKTREWLRSDERNIFTLVIDELHTYRGTSGTEIAYIIKVLLNRLGLSPASPQVRFLASSASMSNSDDSKKYISDFFGTNNLQFDSMFTLITDKHQEETSNTSLPTLEKFTEIFNLSSTGETSCEEAIDVVFKDKKEISEFVKTMKLVEWLRYSLQDKKTGRMLAKPINKVMDILFAEQSEKNKPLFFELFLLLINLAEGEDGLAFQPIRAHYFLRNVEKLYICMNKNCDEVASEFKNKNRQYGKIYNQPLARCPCGSLVYEAIICRHCGELFFCGYKNDENKLFNIPDVYNLQRLEVFYIPDISLFPTGEVDQEKWVKVRFDKDRYFCPDRNGKIFRYKADPKSKSELPNTCPRCDYTIRNGDFTALSRHGTGVQKVNQVCADTLMQILTESKEARKLVIFSDSRQSAAKLAAGIELDHYKDALRQAVLLSFRSNSNLLEYLKKWRNGEIDKVPDEYLAEIKKDKYLKNIRNDIRDEQDGELTDSEKEKLDKNLSGVNPSLEYLITIIMEKLIKAGLNPAGPKPSVFYVDSQIGKKWYECINDDRTGFETDTEQKYRFYQKIESLCRAEILRIMLGSPKRSFESLGLGYYHVQSPIDEVEPEFLDSLVRIIGELNRIVSEESEEQNSFPNRLWNYLKAVKGETKARHRHPILDEVKRHFVDQKIIKDYNDCRLTGENIVFVPAKQGDNVWECEVCKTKHLHKSCGKCTYCFSDLPEVPRNLTSNDLNNTYYTHERVVDKLHCEELTGQTNTKDALDRQRLFQDILYDREKKGIDNIELLSVTTTMEAGVDIGSLLAIMLGNVPPQRFNYQQRVGRAGRRGSPLSIALTVARANSHDQMHYADPDRIVTGDPASPYLDFSSEDIFKRIVYKEILKKAFDDCGISTDQNDNVHGQFGTVTDWKGKNKAIILNWLKAQENIVSDYGYLIGEFEDEEKKSRKTDILKSIQIEMMRGIDKTIEDPNFNQIYLSELLAAGGRLPMFGFPTQVKYLYEKRPRKLPADEVTDRSMDLALATFAPGSEIIKDKKIYLSAGFIDFKYEDGIVKPVDGLVREENKTLYFCPECWYTAVREKIDNGECPICKHVFDKEKGEICNDIRSPKGYCVDFAGDPKDFDGNFNWNPVKINSKLDSEETRKIELQQINDVNLRFGNNVIPDTGVARTINTNNGELFTICRTKDNGWLVPTLSKRSIPSTAEQHQIALVTTKITGIVILALDKENPSVCVNPLDKNALTGINKVRSQIIKSAFLSWGALIRMSVINFLDIRSNELSVDYSVRRDDTEDSEVYPSIYMMEQLENGAGYTNHLASLSPSIKCDVFISPLLFGGEIYNRLTEKHEKNCDTSCYDCLCDYNNQQQHGLLNWRLGLDIALLSSDNKITPKYTEKDSYWRSLLEKNEKILINNDSENELIKKTDYWYVQSEKGNRFIYHPLWSEKYILEKSKEMPNKTGYVSLLEFINNPFL